MVHKCGSDFRSPLQTPSSQHLLSLLSVTPLIIPKRKSAGQRHQNRKVRVLVTSDSFATPRTAACQSITISWSLPKFVSIASVMPSSHLVLWCPLFFLPSVFPSMRGFSSELAVCIRWSKYWSFSFGISPSNEHSGLTSLKTDWFDLLAVWATLRSPLQHRSLKASILWHSALLMVEPSQPHTTLDYMDLCRQSDVCFSTYYLALS